MGRLPATFADRPIYNRVPYAMYGELEILSNQINTVFPSATFENNTDKPFEVHRVIPRFLALDAEGIPLPVQPDQDLLGNLVKVTIDLLGFEQKMLKQPTRPVSLVKGTAERTWEWADPHYLNRANGFTVGVQGMVFPAIDDLNSILVEITFEGFLCVIHPPSNNR